MLNHHGLTMGEMRMALAGTSQVNWVQQALLTNMVRASGDDLERAGEREREREFKVPERQPEGRHENGHIRRD